MLSVAYATVLLASGVRVPGTSFGGDVEILLEGIYDEQGRTLVERGDDHDDVKIDVGPVDALGQHRPRSGRIVRWQDGKGANLVWTLKVTVRHPFSSVRLELVSDVTSEWDFRFMLGTRGRWGHKRAGQLVPRAGFALLSAAVPSGRSIVFQIAVPIADTTPPGDVLTSLRVRATPDAVLDGLRQVESGPRGLSPRIPLPGALPRRQLPEATP